jgi:Skp family chaperone for outer membrane proteins
MQRTILFGICLFALVATGVLIAPQSTNATGAALETRVGSVDIGMVFLEYQRKKDLDEEMRQTEQRVNLEMETRRNRINSFQAVVDAMNVSDPMYVSKTREFLKMQIEFKNWFDLTQGDMTREIGLWTTRIYDDINTTIAEVAQREGFDIVLFHDEFRPRGLDPEVIQEQIARRRVLYVSPSADLTQLVLDALNTKFRAQPKTNMLQVPGVGATP